MSKSDIMTALDSSSSDTTTSKAATTTASEIATSKLQMSNPHRELAEASVKRMHSVVSPEKQVSLILFRRCGVGSLVRT